MSEGKTDTWLVKLGSRRRWAEVDAERVLEAWEASGLSVAAFARRAGFVAQRLLWWRARLGWRAGGSSGKRAVVAVRESATSFVPVTVRAPVSLVTGRLVVTTQDGLRIDVNDVDPETAVWVAQVLRSVQARS